MGMEPQRYCRKCLLREMDETEYFENLTAYIEGLPEETKVSKQEYEERLVICKTCSHLFSGMCRLCGCYVEMRAALRARACPDTPARWQEIKRE